MAGVTSDEAAEGFSSGQRCQSGEALAEWRSSEQVENGTPSTSPPYWDTDDDGGGPKPSDLFGKYTWKIEKFSQISKRELHSNAFEIGGHKWYILIYPQGCDVCNHLSLFLCVANRDKLLPGWSHFAQFTIAVVNKDPKKSKYSDTLHRFWKKEHDWGWKKFMELSKVSDGFLDSSDTLIIKAQVQVIREKADKPFRCLDRQYRRELVRVYLTNVEQICRRFVEERRSKLWKLLEDKNRWKSINDFWKGMDQNSRWRMSREKAEVILKVLVKHFFIEKEVTSTLVLDSLYSGLKALEGQNMRIKEKKKSLDTEQMPDPIVCIEDDELILVDDVLKLLERAALELLPPRDEKGPQNRTKDGNSGEDFNMDSIDRDERHLTELGRRTVEIYVLAHIFSYKIEVAYHEDIALRRQEELIREEAQWLAESDQKVRRGTTDKEKKSKKKQAKQKRNNRKGKEKGRDERAVQDKHQGGVLISDNKDSITEPISENPDMLEDASDVSDTVYVGTEIHQPDSEDRDASQVNSDTDTSEAQTLAEASISGVSRLSSIPNEITEKRGTFAMDDSSSTCSTDSVPSVVTNGSFKGNSNSNYQIVKSPSRGKNPRGKASIAKFTSEMNGHFTGSPADIENVDNVSGNSKAIECDSEAAVSASLDRISRSEQSVVKKVVEEVLPQKKPSTKVSVPPSSRRSPSSPPKNPGSAVQSKPEIKISASIDHALSMKLPSNGSQRLDKPGPTVLSPQNRGTPKPENQNVLTLKSSELPALQQPPAMPRLTPARVGQTSPSLNRSVSATARVGPEPSSAAQSYTPLSYRNAIVGNSVGSISAAFTSPSIGVDSPPNLASGSMNPVQSGLFSGMTNRGTLRNGPHQIESTQGVADEFPHIDIINDLLDEENSNGIATESGGVFQSHSNGQHFQRSYSSLGSLLETARDYVPLASPLAYANGHMDGQISNQWHTNATDVSYMGNAATDGLAYFSSDYSNLSSNGNGYLVFTPSSGI